MRSSLVLLLWGCWLPLLFAQDLPFDPAIRTGRLDNGLSYFLQYAQEPADKIELRLAVKTGSLREAEDQKGVAHVVEHMAFNGTRQFQQNELIRYIESTGARFGADLNAYTGFEETVYQLQARTDIPPQLDTAMQILVDWATGIVFDSLELEKERGVVIAEWRSRQRPEERLTRKVFPFLYAGSLFPDRLPIGDPDLLDTVSVARIRDYYQSWYQPDALGVVISGDLSLDSMENLVRRYFSQIPVSKTPVSAQTYEVPIPQETAAAIFTDEEAITTQLKVLYRSPKQPLRTLSDYRRQLMVNLFNRMLNERLYAYSQQNQVPFTFAYAGFGDDLANISQYQYSLTADPAQLQEGLTLLMQFTKNALVLGFLPEELQRQKDDLLQAAGELVKEADKLPANRLAAQLTAHFLKGSPVLSPEQTLGLYQDLLADISPEDIRLLAADWLNAASIKMVITAPSKVAHLLPDSSSLVQWHAIYDTLTPVPYEEPGQITSLLDIPLPDGNIMEEQYHPETGHITWRLQNGVTILLKPTNFKNDEILVSAFSPGGTSLYPDALYQLASNAANLVQMSGFDGIDAVARDKFLRGKKAGLSPYISELFEGFGGYASPDDLEILLQLTYLYFTSPGKDATALASMKSRQKTVLKNMLDNPYYYFAAVMRRLKYQDHPRRQAVLRESDVDQWTAEGSWQIFRERFADASDFTFLFVGNIDTVQARTLLPRYLGNLPSLGRRESWLDVKADLAEGKIDSTIVRGSAPRARVDLTWHGDFPYSNSKERYRFYTLVAYLNTRLRENLREDLGAVYGVNLNSSLFALPKETYRVTLNFDCSPERVEELIAAVHQEIAKLQSGSADMQTLNSIFEIQRQERKEGLEKNEFWLQQISLRYQYGLPLDGFRPESLENNIRELTREDLSSTSRFIFSTPNHHRFILMPEEP